MSKIPPKGTDGRVWRVLETQEQDGGRGDDGGEDPCQLSAYPVCTYGSADVVYTLSHCFICAVGHRLPEAR
jgi:hypothetical protein